MIERRLDNFITQCRHQLTNAIAEGLNGKIMAIKRRSGGYRNVGNFQGRDLLLLRRPTALPMRNPEGLKKTGIFAVQDRFPQGAFADAVV